MDIILVALEPRITDILCAPGTDLSTISAKGVRKQLLDEASSDTAQFIKENKRDVDALIARVFETVTQGQKNEDSKEAVPSKKRKKESDVGDDPGALPSPKKSQAKGGKGRQVLSDAELARRLSSELNGRSSRRSTSGTPSRRVPRKSASFVDMDDDDSDNGSKTKLKRKEGGLKRKEGGAAKGGFAKEYELSEPLATVLDSNKMSRPQVVKKLWDYIKGHELQNPRNKREIMCDPSLKAVFNVDKIDMFKMNKVLGHHLHEIDQR